MFDFCLMSLLQLYHWRTQLETLGLVWSPVFMAVFGQWTKGDAQLLILHWGDEPSPRKGWKTPWPVSHRAIGQKNGWLEELLCFFFEARELFTELFHQGTLSLLRRGYLTALEEGGFRDVFFWDILGSHKGKAADGEVTMKNCPKCLLQQFLLSVLLKMSWRRFIWASRFQKLLSFF